MPQSVVPALARKRIQARKIRVSITCHMPSGIGGSGWNRKYDGLPCAVFVTYPDRACDKNAETVAE
jgi:hypothetical protein